MTDHSFSVQLASLLGFAQELQTQLQGIAAPMNTLAAQSGVQAQFGAFPEASALAQSQQDAVEEMYALLGQVKQAIGFAENVTNTVAGGYQQADQYVAAALGTGAPGVTPSGQGPATAPGYPAQQSPQATPATDVAAAGPEPTGGSYYYGGVSQGG